MVASVIKGLTPVQNSLGESGFKNDNGHNIAVNRPTRWRLTSLRRVWLAVVDKKMPVAFWRTPPDGLRQQGRRYAPIFIPRAEARGFYRNPAAQDWG
jgi:hypothetical protein